VKAARRARVAVVAGVALLFGGAAASMVAAREARVRAQVGPLVPVVVAARDIRADRMITPSTVASLLSERRVPARFAPPQVLRRPSEAVGFRAGVDIAAGDYITAGSLASADEGRADQLAGSSTGRALEVAVSGAATVLEQLGPGSRVDVLVTSERGSAGRTYLAMQDIELLSARAGSDGSSSGSGERPADAIATLRVSLHDALVLTAAQNFAREIRLLPRPEGEPPVSDPVAVSAGELRP
jgi:pilus assembly protein CpaB